MIRIRCCLKNKYFAKKTLEKIECVDKIKEFN